MYHPYCKPFRLSIALACLFASAPALTWCADATTQKEPAAAENKADAYYHYTLGHLYEELAGAYGNRGDYVNQAINNYRLAMKEDPTASFLLNDIAQLYSAAGMVPEAIKEAESALKTNPDDLDAHRVLANIYRHQTQVGEGQSARIDESMARKSIEQYQFIVSKDPKDVDSLVMLGALQKALGNSVDAEKAFKQALGVEPDNEEAITALASVYSDRGDPKTGAELLERLNQKNASPRTLIALAAEYEQLHQYAQAADAYRRAIELDSSRSDLAGQMAQDLALAGKYDDAIKAYQVFAEANTQSADPYVGMALVYRQQRRWNDAQAALDKAKTIEPNSVDVQYNQVLLLQDEGKLTEAIAGMKSIIATTSKPAVATNGEKAANVEMLDRLGTLYRLNQQYEESVDTYRQISLINPDLASKVDAQIIDTYRMAKEYPKAQKEGDAAAAKYPNDLVVAEARSLVYEDQGKTEDAVAVLRKLLNGKDDRTLYVAIASRYLSGKDYPQAGKALDAAEKLSTTKDDKETVLYLRGSMYEREKQYDMAEKQFRQVLTDDPDNASALNYLGYMLADRGVRLQEAQDYIQRAVHLEPDNYAFLDSLGWVYYHENKLDDAEQQLRRSLQISADDPTIHDHLGDVYVKEGKLKEAIDQWQASLKAYNTTSSSDFEPDDVAKVQKKLDSARVRLAEMK